MRRTTLDTDHVRCRSATYQLRFDHGLLCCRSADLSILWHELRKDLIVLVPRTSDDPILFTDTSVDPFDASDGERRFVLIAEDRTRLRRHTRPVIGVRLHVGMLLLWYHTHEFRHVFGEHPVHALE